MEILSFLIEAHIFRRIDSKIEFLLLKRSAEEYYPNIWQMVTGSVDSDEKAYQTAIREIKEETGINPLKIWVVPNINSFYSHEKEYICLVPVFAAQVNIDSIVKISSEHSDYLWLSAQKAKELLAFPGQRTSVDIINEYFTNANSNLKFVEIDLGKK